MLVSANNYAIDTEGLSQAIQRSGSALSEAGNSIDQALAMYTAGNTTIQNPSSVSTMLKTIALRLQGATASQIEQAGLDSTGMSAGNKSVIKILKTMADVDVLDGTEYRSTYDILNDLAEKWGSLKGVQKAAISQAVAGKRGGNVIASLMQNWDQAKSAVVTSQNSQGSAEREQERYAESLQYRIDQIKASLEELSTNIMSSQALKYLLDVVNTILKWVNAISSTIGSAGSIIAGILGMSTLRGAISDSGMIADFIKSLTNAKTGESRKGMFNNLGLLIGGKSNGKSTLSVLTQALFGTGRANDLAEKTANSAKSMGQYAQTVEGASAATTGLSKATGILSTTIGRIGTVFGIVAMATWGYAAVFDVLTTSYKQAHDSFEENASAAKDAANQIESLNSQLAEKSARIEEINNLGDRTLKEQGELELLQQQTAELETQKKLQESIQSSKAKKAVEDADKSLNTDQSVDDWYENLFVHPFMQLFHPNPAAQYSSDMQNYGYVRDGYVKKYGVGQIEASSMDDYIKYQEQAQKKLQQVQKKMADNPDDVNLSMQYDKIKEQMAQREQDMADLATTLEDYKEAYEQLIKSGGTLSEDQQKDYDLVKKGLKEYTQKDMTEVQKRLDNITQLFDGDKAGETQLEKYIEQMAKSGKQASDVVEELGISLDELNIPKEDFNKYFNDITKSATAATESVSEFSGSLDEVDSAMDSKDADSDWQKVSGYLQTIEDDYNMEKVGSDDFQSAVEFFSPGDTSNLEGFANYLRKADKYTEDYAALRDKIKRYFSPDDTSTDDINEETVSYNNLLEDLVKVGLATKQVDAQTGKTRVTLTDDFTKSSQAAEKLGMSVDSTEVLLHRMENYGFDFGDSFEWNGQNQEEFKSTLDEMSTLYTNLKTQLGSDSPVVSNIGSMVDQYTGQYNTLKGDLSQEQIVKIKFNYDLSQMLADLQRTVTQATAAGGTNTELNASAIVQYQETYNKMTEQMQNRGLEVPQQLAQLTDKINQNISAMPQKIKDGADASQLQQDIMDMQNFQNALAQVELNPGKQIKFTADVDGVETAINAIKDESTGVVTLTANIDGVQQAIYAFGQDEDHPVKFTSDLSKLSQDQKNGLFNKQAVVKYVADAAQIYTMDEHNFDKTITYTYVVKNGAQGVGGGTKHEMNFRTGSARATRAAVDQSSKRKAAKKAQQEAKEKAEKEARDAQLRSGFEAPTNYISGKSNGSGSGDKGNSGSEPQQQDFDWIEVRLSRLSRDVTNLDKIIGATYRSWGERNQAIGTELGKVNEQIQAQTTAYSAYMSYANQVGLSAEWQQKVQSGNYSIDTVKDQDLAKKIQTYKDYYEKALAASDAIEDLRAHSAELAQTSLDHLESQYSEVTDRADHMIDVIGKMQELTESRGYIASTLYNQTMKQYEVQNLATLQQKKSAMVQQRNLAITNNQVYEGTEQWYNMVKQIEAVDSAIYDAQKAIADYDKQIQQAKWDMFDKQEEMLSDLQSEAEWIEGLIQTTKNLTDKDTGEYTDSWLANLGLHIASHNADISQMDDYRKQLAAINQQLEKDPYNNTLLERRQALLKSYRDMTKAAVDEKSAVKDLYQTYYSAVLDALQKLIDKRKDLLSDMSDLRSYEQTVKEQTKTITDLQKQLMSLSGDDSQETKAQRQSLSESLKDAQQDLEDTEYDKWKTDQQNMLDDLYTKYEDFFNDRLDNIEWLFEDGVERVNANREAIGTEIESVVIENGGTLTDTMQSIWAEESTAVSNFHGDFSTFSSNTVTTLNDIRTFCANLQQYAAQMAQQQIAETQHQQAITNNQATTGYTPAQHTTTPTPTPTPAPQQQSSASSGSFFRYKKSLYPKNRLHPDSSIIDRLAYFDIDPSWSARAQYYQGMGLGSASSYRGTSAQNRAMISWMKRNGHSDGMGVGRAIKLSGEDGFILAKSGEQVMSLDKIKEMQEVFKLMNPVVQNVARTNIPNVNNNANTTNQIAVTFSLPNVSNYQDFLREAQNDKRFEKIVQQMTLGNAMGKNTLSKFKY